MEGFHERITIDKRMMGGQPVIKGTRVPIRTILHLLSQGCAIKEVLEDYPCRTGLCGGCP